MKSKDYDTFDDDMELSNSLESDELSDDMYEADIYDELYNEDDDFKPEKSLEDELKEEKKKRKKEFYVKGADLRAELQKYQDSKKTSPDGRRNCF